MSRETKLFLATLLVATTPLFSAWGRDLFVGDETKYSEIIREMRSSGSFFVPRLNGEPYTHKPPLHFWLIALLSVPFGALSIWPYVLPSLAAFLAMLFAIRRIGREMFGESAGAMAAFVFGSSWLAWGLAQTARMDLGFLLFVTIAVFLVHQFLRSAEPRPLYLAGLSTAIAILIKGPMAFVIPAALVAIERLRGRRLPRGPWIRAFLITLTIPMLWLVPAIIIGGREFAHEIVVKQNVGRALGSWVHREPPWFYLTHAPVTLFPWFFMMVVTILALYRQRTGTTETGAFPAESQDSARFCVSWCLAVLVPFSILSGKLDIYMLPILVPMALLIGRFVAGQAEESWRRAAIGSQIVAIVLLAVIGIVGLVGGPNLVRRQDEKLLISSPEARIVFWGFVTAAAIATVVIVLVRAERLWNATIVTGLAALAPLFLLCVTLMGVANEHLSTRPLIRSLERLGAQGSEVALFGCPFLWSRDLPVSLQNVRYVGAGVLAQEDERPRVIASRSKRTHELGSELPRDYVKVDEVRIRGMQFDVYRRR